MTAPALTTNAMGSLEFDDIAVTLPRDNLVTGIWPGSGAIRYGEDGLPKAQRAIVICDYDSYRESNHALLKIDQFVHKWSGWGMQLEWKTLEKECLHSSFHRVFPKGRRYILNKDKRIHTIVSSVLALRSGRLCPSILRVTFNSRIQAFLNQFKTWDDSLDFPLTEDGAKKCMEDINRRLRAIYDEVNDKESKRKYRNARRRSNKNTLSMVNWLNGLFERHSRLLVLRVDFGYAVHMTRCTWLEQAKRDREAFLAQRRSDPLFKHMLGYCWKLEYGPYKGLHYHLLLLYDGSKVHRDVDLTWLLGQRWQTVTDNRGVFFSSNYRARKHFPGHPDNGLGLVAHDDAIKIAALGRVVRYLTKFDTLMCLEVPEGQKTFGRSSLPKARPETRGRPRRHPSIPLSVEPRRP